MAASLLFLFVVGTLAAPAAFTCKSDSGASVAWWTAIKFPSGTQYMYADINNPTFVKSTHDMASTTSGALANTLNPIYNANKTMAWTDYAFTFYNDEKPDGSTSSSRGHTKGVVGLTQNGGFWLVHSEPQFPPYINQGYFFSGATTYGQSFLCMSLGFDQFNNVGTQFYYNYPWNYDYNMPPSWVPSMLYSTVVSSSHTTAAVSNILNLATTPASLTFKSFAKTSNWNNYLYERLVCPTYNSDVYAETWMNGANPDPTFCQNSTIPYDVMNVRTLSACGVNWSETQDHSKWIVSTHNTIHLVCIGDINRQESQNTRAGGTVCFEQTQQWTSFTNAIVTADSCPTGTL